MAKQPTKEQFLKHPRAKALREVCLDIADTVDRLLHQQNVAKVDEYAHLEQLNRRLLQMGITAQCKTGLDKSAYENPLTMAEYVAGQWINALGESIPNEASIRRGGKQAELKNFMVMRSFVNTTRRFLDAG